MLYMFHQIRKIHWPMMFMMQPKAEFSTSGSKSYTLAEANEDKRKYSNHKRLSNPEL